jgi:hypothetical protein
VARTAPCVDRGVDPRGESFHAQLEHRRVRRGGRRASLEQEREALGAEAQLRAVGGCRDDRAVERSRVPVGGALDVRHLEPQRRAISGPRGARG